MNQAFIRTLTEIRDIPDRPHHTCPGYEHWFALQVWKKAQEHFAQQCGPMCAETIMAAGVACCEQSEQGGPGWVGVV